MPHKKKKGYTTRAAATAAATKYALRTGKPIRIYPCGECHCLHLTTEDRRKGKR